MWLLLARGWLAAASVLSLASTSVAGIRCLSCHSDSLPTCYIPFGPNSKVKVHQCEAGVTSCFTQFGANEELERGCLVFSQVSASHTCAGNSCNNVSISNLPLPINSQQEWKEHLRLMKEFMKMNRNPLSCVSCDAAAEDIAALIRDDCYLVPVDRMQHMLERCHRNEACETSVSAERVTRGCTRHALDSAMSVCTSDECNNHVDVVQETRLRQEQSEVEAAAAAGAPLAASVAVLAAFAVLGWMRLMVLN